MSIRNATNPAALVHALQAGRVLVAVVAVADEVEKMDGLLTDNTSAMSVVSMVAQDGRRGLLAFTGIDSLQAWDPSARPVPVTGVDAALAVDADVIGINNRNLDDLSVDLATTLELITEVPAGMTVVSESGIATREAVMELDRVGVDAVLVGEALLSSGEPETAFAELFPDEEGTSEHKLP